MPYKTILMLMMMIGLSTSAQKTRQTIAVVYYNQVDTDLKEQFLLNIKSTYNCTVTEINGSRTLSSKAYYKPRGRYRASELLVDLSAIRGYDKVIGITTKDISTTKGSYFDWGVMGLAYCPGRSCVISTYRIKTSNKTLFNDRFIKVGLHEIGHTFGIPHCTFSRTCFMESAEGTIKSVDRETRTMCTNCKIILNR